MHGDAGRRVCSASHLSLITTLWEAEMPSPFGENTPRAEGRLLRPRGRVGYLPTYGVYALRLLKDTTPPALHFSVRIVFFEPRSTNSLIN